MPATYRFDSNIVVVELVGEYSIDDLRATILNSLDNPQRPANSHLLFDFTKSRSIHDRSAEQVKDMAKFLGSLGNRLSNRIAFVVPDELVYGFARMGMGAAGAEQRGIEAEVFHTFAEAREWLLS